MALPSPDAPRRRHALGPVALLAWLAVGGAVVAVMLEGGARWQDAVAYLAAWLVGSTLPGVLVWRALAGPSTAVRELGFGAVLGIPLQFGAWAVATAVHQPGAQWLLPVGTVAAFAAVPRLRRYWWPRRAPVERTPLRWHLAMAFVVLLALLRLSRRVVAYPMLPPRPSALSADVWYNSAIAYEVSRTLRPQDPFVLGEPLRYHWFADAHAAATAQLAGVPVVDAMVVLWLVPMVVVVLLATAAAAQHLLDDPQGQLAGGTGRSDVRRWWVGPVAGFFVLVAPAVWRLGRPVVQRVGDGFVASSASGILATALVLGLAGPLVDVVRGRGRRGNWVVLALLLAVSAGTKPSILPIVACGAALVVVVQLVRTRRLHRPALAVVAAAAVLVLVSFPVLAGSTGGSHLQLLSLARLDLDYERLLRRDELPGQGGWLLTAVAQPSTNGLVVVAVIVVVRSLAETPRLLALVGLTRRAGGHDPAAVWVAGVMVSGFVAMWSLSHPGYSQHWFWTIAAALATALTVVQAVRMVPADRRLRRLAAPLLAYGALGVAAALLTRPWTPEVGGPVWVRALVRLVPYAVVLAGAALAVLLARLARTAAPRWSLPALTAVTVFALAAGVPDALGGMLTARPPRLQAETVVDGDPSYVAPEQQRAATWLRQHTEPDAVVSTNMMCWPLGTHNRRCRHPFMWLQGISGRRTVMGDWLYSSASLDRYDGTFPYARMPSPWPDRVRLSREAVMAPTPAVLGRLRTQFGARYLFADSRATPISPDLPGLASLVYRSEHIQIYRLRDRYP